MPEATHNLLDEKILSHIDNLEWLSQQVVDGYLSGKHRSKFKSGTVEFAEHKMYAPGDDLRTIDWRAYAKADRYYIKLYDEETRLDVIFLVDASGSMHFAESTPSKYQISSVLTACLSRWILRQYDAAGLLLTGGGKRDWLEPRSKATHLHSLIDNLKAHQSESTDVGIAPSLKFLAQRLKRRSRVFIFSDFFEEPEALLAKLKYLRHGGHEVVLVHTLAPEEVDFEVQGWTRFESLEGEEFVELDPLSVRKVYLERFEDFTMRLKAYCKSSRFEYLMLRSDAPLGEVLASFLYRLSKGR